MKQQRTDARSLTADQQKRIEEVCFRSLALIGHNCEYLEQHFDRTGADESTRQAVADINAAAVKLDRTLSEAMTLLEFLRGDEKPQLYPVDLCDLLRQVAAQADMIRAQLGVEIHLDYGGWTSCCALADRSDAELPIGDVTTIMLWINDNITSGNIMKGLFLPSVISLAIPVWLVSYSLKSNSITTPSPTSGVSSLYLGKQEQTSILIIGILCLLAVPIFKSLTDLPPFAGILFTLGFLWFYTDCLYNRKKTDSTGLKYRIPDVLTKVDFSTILFFFGILMAVAALEAIGLLHQLSDLLNSGIHNVYIITGIIGFLSSVIDNVPLVAAAMGMYPLTAPATAGGIPETAYLLNFVSDGNFWKLLAYCAGTGGSILIIGSAAGVVVMGLEKISFTWYMRHISWIAITGFLAGIGIYYLQNLIF